MESHILPDLPVPSLPSIPSLQALLRQLDRKLWCAGDSRGDTPLHVAASHGNCVALQQGFFKRDIWVLVENEEEEGDEEGEGGSDVEVSEGEQSEGGPDSAQHKKVNYFKGRCMFIHLLLAISCLLIAI